MNDRDQPYAGHVAVLSALPARIRWRLPVLIDQSDLARAVVADLQRHPAVWRAHASSVTGSLLAELVSSTSHGHVEHQLRRSIGRQLARRGEARVLGSPGAATRFDGLRLLLRWSEPHREARRRAIGWSLLNGFEDAVPPLLVGLASNTATQGGNSLLSRLGCASPLSRLFGFGSLSVVLWVLAAAIECRKGRTLADLARSVTFDLRTALYEHVQRLDPAEIEVRDVSDWMAILDRDVASVDDFLRSGVDPWFQTATNLVLVAVTLAMASPMAIAVQLLTVPALTVASVAWLRPIRTSHRQKRDDHERWHQIVSGNLAGMATVTGFGAEVNEADRVREIASRSRASTENADAAETVYVPGLRFIAGAGFVATLISGVTRVASGAQDLGATEASAMAQLRLLSSIARIGVSLERYQRTAAALTRINRTLETRATLVDGPIILSPSTTRGELVFDSVGFGYRPSKPVLKSVTIRIPAGATVGLVGASGAGKSTVLRLLMRFWDPQRGGILLDGHDLRRYTVDSLRRALAVVAQRITLFQGTIRENISYARRDARLDDVIAAAKTAEVHDFVASLPEGYETTLGFGGVTLSGGQRQRLAIARAVLADRPILLFDEATSSLDHATEAAVQRSLADVTRDRTTVIVAHRLATVRHADRIYVLADGAVHEQGRHDELLALDGLYAAMWRVQIGER